jgi:hypothetical protein
MAPNNLSNPRPTKNMSSFNQFYRASTAAPQQRAPSGGTALPLSASFREVLVGKDKRAIQLPVLPPSSEAKHLRQFRFRQFRALLLQHEDDHTSSELTTVIQQEIPIDSIQESFFCAQAVRKQILGAPFQVQHLEFLGLLDSACAQVVIDADIADPAKRQHDISYVQLKCSVNPSDFVHGAQDVACSPIQFCLQLPAHSRSSVGVISLLHSPAKKPSSMNSAAQPSALSGARQQLFANAGFSTPARPPIPAAQGNGLTPPSVSRGSTAGTPTSTIGVSVATSPKFQSFLSVSAASGTSVTGYFGELTFLDDQQVFQDTFGVQPLILPFWPNDPAEHPKEALVALSDKCYLRCFLDQCQLDYVGEESDLDNAKALQEITSAIHRLQQITTAPSGQRVSLSPDDLYLQYMALLPSLPEDCSTWSLVPSHAFFHALSPMLQETIEDTDYVLPATNALSSRSAHLAALRELRSVAASSYKSLKKQQTMMKSLFGASQRSSNQTYAYTPTLPPTQHAPSEHLGTPPPNHPTYAYNSKSPAEQVLEEHLGRPPPSAPDGMKLVQVNGKTHIFNEAENYTSKWPLGFHGCYRCGSTATKQGCDPRESCPSFRSCSLNDFFKELHTHKPRTRRREPVSVSFFYSYLHYRCALSAISCFRINKNRHSNSVFGSTKTVPLLCFRINKNRTPLFSDQQKPYSSVFGSTKTVLLCFRIN